MRSSGQKQGSKTVAARSSSGRPVSRIRLKSVSHGRTTPSVRISSTVQGYRPIRSEPSGLRQTDLNISQNAGASTSSRERIFVAVSTNLVIHAKKPPNQTSGAILIPRFTGENCPEHHVLISVTCAMFTKQTTDFRKIPEFLDERIRRFEMIGKKITEA